MLFVGFVVVRQRIEEAAWQVETSERSLAEAQEWRTSAAGRWMPAPVSSSGRKKCSGFSEAIHGSPHRLSGWQPRPSRGLAAARSQRPARPPDGRQFRSGITGHPADGAIRHLVVKAKVWRGSKDKIARLLGTAQDITVRKETEDKLRKLSRAIEQSTVTVIVTTAAAGSNM